MGKTIFAAGEHYHICNRGVDKRKIFMDGKDLNRFLKSVEIFNTIEPVGSIYEYMLDRRLGRVTSRKGRLVDIVCYCLNPNHFHLLVRQQVENGVSEFVKRLVGGYTKYFNHRHNRSGVLFAGKFRSTHIVSNEYLLHVSAYINLNNEVHGIKQAIKSSWEEYIGNTNKKLCNTAIILKQFQDAREYKDFARASLADIIARKSLSKELEGSLLE
ncbi:MAG: hypothetical protein EXS68_00730 [Candidatus Ryanbacteria bacterium]|nr:hypothetical protein [Candidatus Ryanbacteria bacterium]